MNWRILDDFGSKELKGEMMPKFANKDVFTCFALTEESGGSGADLHSVVTKDGDDYILNGEKTLISHTDCSQYAYVFAASNPEADKDHLHHRLMSRGWTAREVVLLVYVLTLILSVAAIFLAIVKGA